MHTTTTHSSPMHSSGEAASQALMRETLLGLLATGWVTPLEALQNANCMSLSQRCSEFIRDGLTIQKKWIALPSGKRVMSYRLDASETQHEAT